MVFYLSLENQSKNEIKKIDKISSHRTVHSKDHLSGSTKKQKLNFLKKIKKR